MRQQKRQLVELNYLGVQMIPALVTHGRPLLQRCTWRHRWCASPSACVFTPCFGVFVCVSVSCPVGPEQWSPKFSIWQKRLGTTTRTLSQVNLYDTSGTLKHCARWPFINLYAIIKCCLLPQRYVVVMWPVSTETGVSGALPGRLQLSW